MRQYFDDINCVTSPETPGTLLSVHFGNAVYDPFVPLITRDVLMNMLHLQKDSYPLIWSIKSCLDSL